ncbi:MAG: DUF1573 domain-containing protein [Prevotella sp.]|nr:DUF1573 domain-containing protein [Prevotella sp.]
MMTRIYTVMLCLLTALTVGAQESKYLKTFEFDERIHNFGTIEEKDGKVSHTFTFTNRGKETVTIKEVNAMCGCTTAAFSKAPVKPGQQAKVTLTYDPSHRPGHFSKEAVVLLNDGDYYTRIWIKGDVVEMVHPVTEDHPYAYGEGLYMSHRVIPFSVVKPGEQDSIRVLVANDSQEPMTVTFSKQPNNRLLQLPEKLTLKAGQRTLFYAKYKALRTYPYRRYITLQPYVNGKAVKTMRVTWVATRN